MPEWVYIITPAKGFPFYLMVPGPDEPYMDK